VTYCSVVPGHFVEVCHDTIMPIPRCGGPWPGSSKAWASFKIRQ
jgi:hypothetical protein